MWCRGTITKIIPIKTRNKQKNCGPVKCRVCDIAVVKIFLIDFGSYEVFNFSSRRAPAERPDLAAVQTIETDDICLLMRKPDQHIEAELATVPPLAVQCSLKDIVPKNAGEGWEEEAKKRFLGMVNNKVVLMTVFREEDGILIVDLSKPPCNKICSGMPVSLKDTLVFLDLARFKSHHPNQSKNKTVFQNSGPKMQQEREVVSVTVRHINSPSDFYLQLAGGQVDVVFPEKIQEVHKDSKDTTVACLVEGQACFAKHGSGNWYRAQIIGLPHREDVVVKYTDFGSVANVPLEDIRSMEDEFLSFPGKVLLYDYGAEKTVDISCLRELEESMKRIRTFAVGCALADIRTDKGAVARAIPKKCPEVHLEQESPQLSSWNSEPACARGSAGEEEGSVSKSDQNSCETPKSLLPLETNKTYKAPILPKERTFRAVVSCVGNDGTIYIVPKAS
ncbi:UNVERIFIED_CONTAM: hypothetical protein H355_000855, partial [Colinus virginianus]